MFEASTYPRVKKCADSKNQLHFIFFMVKNCRNFEKSRIFQFFLKKIPKFLNLAKIDKKVYFYVKKRKNPKKVIFGLYKALKIKNLIIFQKIFSFYDFDKKHPK